jgi:hypothetical protein
MHGDGSQRKAEPIQPQDHEVMKDTQEEGYPSESDEETVDRERLNTTDEYYEGDTETDTEEEDSQEEEQSEEETEGTTPPNPLDNTTGAGEPEAEMRDEDDPEQPNMSTDNKEPPREPGWTRETDNARATITAADGTKAKLSRTRLNIMAIAWPRTRENKGKFGAATMALLTHAYRTGNDDKHQCFYSANVPPEILKWAHTNLHLRHQILLNPLYTTSGIFTEPDPNAPGSRRTIPPTYMYGSTPPYQPNNWATLTDVADPQGQTNPWPDGGLVALHAGMPTEQGEPNQIARSTLTTAVLKAIMTAGKNSGFYDRNPPQQG